MRSKHQKLGISERLKRKTEYKVVYEQGRRLPGKYFVGYVLWKREGRLRLGVVASRRVGNAVHRNRAKRILREIFRKNKPQKRAQVAADVVLIARAAMKEASYFDVEKAYVQGVCRALERRNDTLG